MANILRFVILGEDRGGPAFAQFTRQVEKANAAVDRNNAALKRQGTAAAAARSGLGGLAGEVTGFGAAADAASSRGNKFKLALAGLNLASGVLEPAMAGIVVAVGGLGAGLATAGAGLGAFGLVAKANFTAASTAATAASTAQQAHAAAVAKVTGQYQYAMSVAKTRAQRQAAYAAEQKGFNTAELAQTAALNKAYAGLSPAQVGMAKQIASMKTQWQSFTATFAPMLNQMLGTVRPVFGIILKDIGKLATAGGTALQTLLPSLGAAIGSSGFQKFITMLATNAAPAIVRIGVAIGNVVVGIGGLLKAFLPTSQQMLTGLDKITAKFREWGTTLSGHTGFQSLMATFRTETPQAVAILRNLGVVIGNVGKAMFGLSTFSNSRLLLSALLPLSGVMASLSRNTNLVRVALYALLAVKIGQQFSWIGPAWKSMVLFSGAAKGATVAQVIAAAATRAWGLAMAALPWVALATAVVVVAVLIIKYHRQIWAFVQRVWHDVLAVIMAVWTWVRTHWPLLLAILTGPIGLFILWVVRNFGKVSDKVKATADIMKNVIGIAWDRIELIFLGGVRFVVGLLARLPGPLGAPFRRWRDDLAGVMRQITGDIARRTGQIQGDINRIRGKRVGIDVHGSGSGGAKITISSVGGGPFAGKLVALSNRAAGGRVGGHGGPRADDQLIAASSGEFVHQVSAVKKYGIRAMEAVNRGRAVIAYAAGGLVDPGPFVSRAEGSYGTDAKNAFGAEAAQAFKAAVASATAAVKAELGGSGQAVLNYALRYLHKVPYVWGGSTPSGWDCSGYVSWVLDHLGLFHGRTDAAGFQRWARPSSPVPGGLAFYGNPAHHVGFVMPGGRLLSALGHAFGTTISSLRMGDNSGYGIPPRGFGPGGASAAGPGGSKLKELAFTLLSQYGWANQWPAFNSLENREASWSMTARNPSSGAYGLAQFINGPSEYFQYGGNPNTALGQLTAMLNYIGQRYRSPNAAWAHEVSAGWYDRGGYLQPGWNLAYNGTGRPEPVGHAAGGGNTYNITVNVPATASKADTGRVIVEHIRAYEQGSGKGWRR